MSEFGPWQAPLVQTSHVNQYHHLLIGHSKHFYSLRSGNIRYQRKALDPRACGQKALLSRFIMLDVHSGTFYGEYHLGSGSEDLLGFLARAWIQKASHPMHGLPKQLNVPQAAQRNETFHRTFAWIRSVAHIAIGSLPSGFRAGAHVVRQLECEALDVLARFHTYDDPLELHINDLQALSGAMSDLATSAWSRGFAHLWGEVSSVPEHLLRAIDAQYRPAGAWREAPFDYVINGAPQSEALDPRP